MKELKASKKFAIRFSEVDSMNVVWLALTLFTLKTPERRSVKSMDWSIWAFLLTAIMHHWLTFPFIIRSQSNMG